MQEQPIRPFTQSADGRANAYFHRCVRVGHCRPYAACLSLVSAAESGPLSSNYSDCSTAIRGRECPALAMREEERLAGRAIYFAERLSFGDIPQSAVSVNATPRRDLSRQRKQSVLSVINIGGYADAINRAQPQAAPVTTIQPVEGESPLDFARRVMATQTHKEQ